MNMLSLLTSHYSKNNDLLPMSVLLFDRVCVCVRVCVGMFLCENVFVYALAMICRVSLILRAKVCDFALAYYRIYMC